VADVLRLLDGVVKAFAYTCLLHFRTKIGQYTILAVFNDNQIYNRYTQRVKSWRFRLWPRFRRILWPLLGSVPGKRCKKITPQNQSDDPSTMLKNTGFNHIQYPLHYHALVFSAGTDPGLPSGHTIYRVTVLRPAALMQRPGCEPESLITTQRRPVAKKKNPLAQRAGFFFSRGTGLLMAVRKNRPLMPWQTTAGS
jgi:hypothetical protein